MTLLEDIHKSICDILQERHNNNEVKSIDEFDSFEFIQIVLEIEDMYDIEFDENKLTLDVLKDLDALSLYIQQKIDSHDVLDGEEL